MKKHLHKKFNHAEDRKERNIYSLMEQLEVLPTLTELFKTAQSAKYVYKSYLPVYDEYFLPLKDTATAVLEIGILDGVSLRVMRDYFTKAHIYGIEAIPHYIFQEERITTIHCSTMERDRFISLELPPFDIIIDDASHVITEQLFAVCGLWKYLKTGGLFIVEDIQRVEYLECFKVFNADIFDYSHLGKSADDRFVIIKKLC